MLARVREYFAGTGVLEVETPALVRSPVTDVHLESLRVVDDVTGLTQGYLHTSPEYAMKRLLCEGSPDIYQVCRVFRAAERGRRHNPEFTMIEWYRLGIDHHALMRDVESVIRAALGSQRMSHASEFVTYQAAFERAVGVDPLSAPTAEIAAAIERKGLALPDSMRTHATRDDLLDFAMATLVADSFAKDRLTVSCMHSPPARRRSRASTGPWPRVLKPSGARSNWRTAFTNSVRRDEQRARFEADGDARRVRAQPARDYDTLFLAALRCRPAGLRGRRAGIRPAGDDRSGHRR